MEKVDWNVRTREELFVFGGNEALEVKDKYTMDICLIHYKGLLPSTITNTRTVS